MQATVAIIAVALAAVAADVEIEDGVLIGTDANIQVRHAARNHSTLRREERDNASTIPSQAVFHGMVASYGVLQTSSWKHAQHNRVS